MEITSKFKDIETHHHSPLNSPSSHGSSTTSNGPNHGPIPITRSDPNSPYPTTFVTADTSSFKQVVQMLTGSPKPKPDPKQPDPNPKQINHLEQQHHQTQQHSYVIPPVKTTSTKPGFKLYERRNSSLKNMMISPLPSNYHSNQSSSSFSPRNHSNYHHFNHINGGGGNNNYPLSPSLLDFPSLTLSPVTPLVIDTFDKSSPSITSQITSSSSVEEEEKAIAEKGFYLHPSPRDSNPKLLPLFPLSSPRVSDP
ncbi:VQ motif-containing protein 4 [Silene latifolia]|uniref:VQ motif-containing protein 4 n=1 Tax=Silene latifolia TaxID=37657 RepID=UPI003D784CD5